MKRITLLLNFSLCYTFSFAQLDDAGSTNNGSMTLGTGTGTFYQFAGDQRGTDGTNQSQGGFGILSGSNQISPIVWMFSAEGKNAFQVRRKYYNSTVQSGTTLLHVDTDGNIGIGTDDPSHKLEIVGSGTSTTIARLGSGGNANFRQSRGSSSFDGGYLFYTGATLDWRFQESASGNDLHITDESMGLNIMTFQDNTGFVGLGTNTPECEFDIDGTLQSDYLKINASTSIEGGEIRLDGSSGYNNWMIDNYQGKFRLHHSGTNQFTVHPNGQVGIGTGNTAIGTHKLAVEGSIGAREIKVIASGWSDFVFEEDYTLRPLEEVETYITENKHLPEIPSEAEVTENGINLGEMNAKLLQKIEELTLYMIEQNKEMTEVNKQLQAQKEEIEVLKKKINN